MCSCGSSQGIIEGSSFSSSYNISNDADVPCEFTIEQLRIWEIKLKWFKDSGAYKDHGIEASLLNKYLGVVMTSINVNNKCVYRSILLRIEPLITFIISLES